MKIMDPAGDDPFLDPDGRAILRRLDLPAGVTLHAVGQRPRRRAGLPAFAVGFAAGVLVACLMVLVAGVFR